MLLFFGVRLLSDTEFEKKHMKALWHLHTHFLPSLPVCRPDNPLYARWLGGPTVLLLAYEIFLGGWVGEAPCV